MATDLAEFVGAAIGINLIFDVPRLAAGRRLTSTLMLLTTIIITGLNLYLLYDALIGLP